MVLTHFCQKAHTKSLVVVVKTYVCNCSSYMEGKHLTRLSTQAWYMNLTTSSSKFSTLAENNGMGIDKDKSSVMCWHVIQLFCIEQLRILGTYVCAIQKHLYRMF